MKVFLGMDCGGSSTRVVAVDEAGVELFSGKAGEANLARTPPEVIRENLHLATIGSPEPTSICGCFAGLISEEKREYALSLLHERFPLAVLRAEPDYLAAVYAAPDGTDISIIAGTGSLVCARVDDHVFKSGGGGYLLGDAGSAFQFGRSAVSEFVASPTDASPDAARQIIEVFGTDDTRAIVSAVYSDNNPPALLAKCASIIARDFELGKPYAVATLHQQWMELGALAHRQIREHFNDQPIVRVALTGGLWKASPVFQSTFEASLKEVQISQKISVGLSPQEAVIGAVKLAMKMP